MTAWSKRTRHTRQVSIFDLGPCPATPVCACPDMPNSAFNAANVVARASYQLVVPVIALILPANQDSNCVIVPVLPGDAKAWFMGINIVYETLGDTMGYFTHDFRIKFIHLNQQLNAKDSIYTCGHELGHAILQLIFRF